MPLLSHADLSAYNEYSGWYYHTPSNFGARLDALHATDPGRRIGISEYGAGASIYQHTEWPGTPAGSAQRPVPHPEEYQAYYHQQLWPQIEARDYLWGTFVWNMFDFASDFRNEGDRPGRNDKGLVTYDRKVRKDAFYYYKSARTDTPTVHIVSKAQDAPHGGSHDDPGVLQRPVGQAEAQRRDPNSARRELHRRVPGDATAPNQQGDRRGERRHARPGQRRRSLETPAEPVARNHDTGGRADGPTARRAPATTGSP